MLWINHQKDFASGLLLAVLGAGFALGAADYPMGTTASMGPGFFPRALGILLAGLGVLLAIKSVGGRQHRHGDIGRWDLRPLFFVIGANFVFGVLLTGLPFVGLPPMGLLVSVFVLVLLASAGGLEFTLRGALVLAVVLSAFACVLLTVVLGLPLRVLPAFLG
ncbi:hypothetical protein CJ010_16510 [Azoarcus sp. DD4]|uniref:tripartite tricarboxylate transporter TctB family protein n=1 Tax=Azoarcus sp. DD4 TaxID=2027405 RepID=UPI00112CD7E8|nr:tripartite tricarboxylate transporter TctB family protein [Azoarcus sp. DD4]QDF98020.1 hypothetical protein CJ010_16510 [Azoarcus sp. DD4]